MKNGSAPSNNRLNCRETDDIMRKTQSRIRGAEGWQMNRRKNRRGYLLIAGGVTMIAAALCLTGYNFWEERQAAASVGVVWEQLMLEIPEKEDESFNPQTAKGVPEVMGTGSMPRPAAVLAGVL